MHPERDLLPPADAYRARCRDRPPLRGLQGTERRAIAPVGPVATRRGRVVSSRLAGDAGPYDLSSQSGSPSDVASCATLASRWRRHASGWRGHRGRGSPLILEGAPGPAESTARANDTLVSADRLLVRAEQECDYWVMVLVARGRRMTITAVLLGACVSTLLASASAASPERVRVSCSNIIGNETTHEEKTPGLRLVLGSVVVPVGSTHKAIPVLAHQRWRYWMKAGVDVRAGAGPPVTISLRQSWVKKARVTWGNGLPRGTTVEFARCAALSKSQPWNGYAGGFYISTRSACVPLQIRVGRATAAVTIAIGRRCH
jgi:hypothetical protein